MTDPAFRAGAVAVPKATAAGVSFDPRRVGVYEGTSGPKGHLKWMIGDAAAEPDGFVMTTEDPPNGVPRGLLLGRIAGVANAIAASNPFNTPKVSTPSTAATTTSRSCRQRK